MRSIALAVEELIEAFEARNNLVIEDIISVTFTATKDLNAIFPTSIARRRRSWQNVPLLDVQQMFVENSLQKCIRVLIDFNTFLKRDRLNYDPNSNTIIKGYNSNHG